MLPFTPQMRLLSHIVASAFLVLVGVSLALAHRNGLNLRAFWRRLAIVAGAAALVTAGSFVFAPSEPITFGILHCIAVASLLAAPVRDRAGLGQSRDGLRGDRRAVARPLDPVRSVLAPVARARRGAAEYARLAPAPAVGGRRLSRPRRRAPAGRPDGADVGPSAGAPESAPSRAICFAGRHSLPIYLVHQPILIGLLAALTAWGPLAPKPDRSAFLASCQRACVAKGRAEAECETGCRCVADAVDQLRRRRPAGDGHAGAPGRAQAARRRLHGAVTCTGSARAGYGSKLRPWVRSCDLRAVE